MIVFVVLLLFVIHILLSKTNRSKYDYKCFLLTLKDQKKRQERFIKTHNKDIPLEIIYGPDTRTPKQAEPYEILIEDEYYEKAVEMYEDPQTKRPDFQHDNTELTHLVDQIHKTIRQSLQSGDVFAPKALGTMLFSGSGSKYNRLTRPSRAATIISVLVLWTTLPMA